MFRRKSNNPVDPELDAWPIERASIGFPVLNREQLEDVFDTELFEVERKLDSYESERLTCVTALQPTLRQYSLREEGSEEEHIQPSVRVATRPSGNETEPSVRLTGLQSRVEVERAMERPKRAGFYKYEDSFRRLRRESHLNSKRNEEESDCQPKSEADEEEEEVEGLFGVKTKVSKWSVSYQLAKRATLRTKRVVAWTALLLCLLGLVVSLHFVTRDFLSSRAEQASTIRHTSSDKLAIPTFWICSSDTAFPFFNDFPNNEYPGDPLVWLDLFEGSKDNVYLKYPDTNKMRQLSTLSVSMRGHECQAASQMDAEIMDRENTEKPSCFHCLSFNRAPPLEIEQVPGKNAIEGLSSHVAVRMSMQDSLMSCRMIPFGISQNVLNFLRGKITNHSGELQRRGILEFGGLNPLNISHQPLLWPDYRMGYLNASLDIHVLDVVDMLCNVYLLAGYFYPSSSKNISYTFNPQVFRWERRGSGPYYPERVVSLSVKEASEIRPNGNSIGLEMYDNLSFAFANTITLLTNQSKKGQAERMASITSFQTASLSFERNVIHGNETFQTKTIAATLEVGDRRNTNFAYFVDMKFQTFLTRIVTEQQTMSWTAYFADFFGLTSLFLDVSVYTVIIAPLVLRLRRRVGGVRIARKAKKNKNNR